jgi:hypothetical protein
MILPIKEPSIDNLSKVSEFILAFVIFSGQVVLTQYKGILVYPMNIRIDFFTKFAARTLSLIVITYIILSLKCNNYFPPPIFVNFSILIFVFTIISAISLREYRNESIKYQFLIIAIAVSGTASLTYCAAAFSLNGFYRNQYNFSLVDTKPMPILAGQSEFPLSNFVNCKMCEPGLRYSLRPNEENIDIGRIINES